jgi:hypothetical protein
MGSLPPLDGAVQWLGLWQALNRLDGGDLAMAARQATGSNGEPAGARGDSVVLSAVGRELIVSSGQLGEHSAVIWSLVPVVDGGGEAAHRPEPWGGRVAPAEAARPSGDPTPAAEEAAVPTPAPARALLQAVPCPGPAPGEPPPAPRRSGRPTGAPALRSPRAARAFRRTFPARWPPAAVRLAVRYPLLAAFLLWFAGGVGIAALLPLVPGLRDLFALWGLGFLALLLLGFVASAWPIRDRSGRE